MVVVFNQPASLHKKEEATAPIGLSGSHVREDDRGLRGRKTMRRFMLSASILLAFSAPAMAQVRPQGCNTDACTVRVQKRVQCATKTCYVRVIHREWKKIIAPWREWLYATRMCESGSSGLYRANTGNGFYAAYQFTMSTWNSVGGSGYPHNASRIEQDYRAVRVLLSQGKGAWPYCGKH